MISVTASPPARPGPPPKAKRGAAATDRDAAEAAAREAFLHDWRWSQVATVRIGPHDGGYAISGRPYVARRYHLRTGATGWTMVHDDPDALRYFDKLFGTPTAVGET